MEPFFIYLLKASVLVIVFYLSYHFLLKKETFFNQSRWFLLSGLVTSLVLPIITITKTVWIEPLPMAIEKPFILPDFSINTIVTEEQKNEINWILMLGGIYALGMLFFLLKFIFSSLSLYKILYGSSIKKQNGFLFIDSKNVKTPFSFFNYIAFDSTCFSEEELKNIIAHEKVHSKQKHSFDIIFSELFSVVFWFNPFVWLYKKAIQQNLEFIADSNAIKTSDNKIAYQKTLVKITLNQRELALANSFYQPLIKKRIMMLNKIQSRKGQLWKYFVVLPLLAVFVMQFQTEVIAQEKKQNTKEITHQGEPALITPDTIVWVKDFSKAYNGEITTQVNGDKIVVKGGTWEDAKNYLKSKQDKDVLHKKPLYIVNGKEIPKEKITGNWHIEGKITIKEYDIKEAVEKFGEKGKDGVIVVEGDVKNIYFESDQYASTNSNETETIAVDSVSDIQDNVFIISTTSSDADIDKIKTKLQEIGIEMKISSIKRNKNGEIYKIKISLFEGFETKNHKLGNKAAATFEIENGNIPDIYVGKRNGGLVVSSSK